MKVVTEVWCCCCVTEVANVLVVVAMSTTFFQSLFSETFEKAFVHVSLVTDRASLASCEDHEIATVAVYHGSSAIYQATVRTVAFHQWRPSHRSQHSLVISISRFTMSTTELDDAAGPSSVTPRISTDRQSLTWSRVNLSPRSCLPPPRSGAASVVVRGKLFMFGVSACSGFRIIASYKVNSYCTQVCRCTRVHIPRMKHPFF